MISANGVTVGTTPIVVGGDHCVPPPAVSLVRAGNDISAIEIRCSCGEIIILDCVYDQSQDPTPSTQDP